MTSAIPGRWGSVLTAMVTPFDDDLRVDLDAAVTIARWLQDHGTDGLVIAGTTGEAPTLNDTEKRELWQAVVEAVTIPVIAGSTSNDTAHSVHLTKTARDCGVAGILAVTPYYSRPGQAGLTAHFTAVAEASGALPVMLYDIPIRTGRKIEHETILALANRVSNIVALKDAAQSPSASAALAADAPEGFELYSGDDNLTLPFLSVGACGVVSVCSHWCGELLQDLMTAFSKGDVDEARRINARLIPSYSYMGSDRTPSPNPTKAMMRHLGLPVGMPRPPMVVDEATTAELEATAAEIATSLGLS